MTLPHILLALTWALARIAVLVAVIFVAGGHFVPWLLAHIARTRSRELFTLAVLVLAIGLAVSATKWFGVSAALGAFLAGLVVGQSEFSSRAASEALPMRDAFAVLFFVSIGMLFDPSYLLQSPAIVASTLAIILVGKPLAALFIVALMRYSLSVAISVAVALAQVGEFSFILASLGRQLEILPASGDQRHRGRGSCFHQFESALISIRWMDGVGRETQSAFPHGSIHLSRSNWHNYLRPRRHLPLSWATVRSDEVWFGCCKKTISRRSSSS